MFRVYAPLVIIDGSSMPIRAAVAQVLKLGKGFKELSIQYEMEKKVRSWFYKANTSVFAEPQRTFDQLALFHCELPDYRNYVVRKLKLDIYTPRSLYEHVALASGYFSHIGSMSHVADAIAKVRGASGGVVCADIPGRDMYYRNVLHMFAKSENRPVCYVFEGTNSPDVFPSSMVDIRVQAWGKDPLAAREELMTKMADWEKSFV